MASKKVSDGPGTGLKREAAAYRVDTHTQISKRPKETHQSQTKRNMAFRRPFTYDAVKATEDLEESRVEVSDPFENRAGGQQSWINYNGKRLIIRGPPSYVKKGAEVRTVYRQPEKYDHHSMTYHIPTLTSHPNTEEGAAGERFLRALDTVARACGKAGVKHADGLEDFNSKRLFKEVAAAGKDPATAIRPPYEMGKRQDNETWVEDPTQAKVIWGKLPGNRDTRVVDVKMFDQFRNQLSLEAFEGKPGTLTPGFTVRTVNWVAGKKAHTAHIAASITLKLTHGIWVPADEKGDDGVFGDDEFTEAPEGESLTAMLHATAGAGDNGPGEGSERVGGLEFVDLMMQSGMGGGGGGAGGDVIAMPPPKEPRKNRRARNRAAAEV